MLLQHLRLIFQTGGLFFGTPNIRFSSLQDGNGMELEDEKEYRGMIKNVHGTTYEVFFYHDKSVWQISKDKVVRAGMYCI